MVRRTGKDYSYSARLAQPFVRALGNHPAIPREISAEMDKMDPDDWITYSDSHELIRGAVELTGDVDIGLHAAEAMETGDFGVVDYIYQSSSTGVDAINGVNRYIGLLNDGARFRFDWGDDVSVWHLKVERPEPRQSHDYSTAIAAITIRERSERRIMPIEVWLAYPRPARTDEHERIFEAPLRFGAANSALVFCTADLEQPIVGADEQLNTILHKYAQEMLERLPREDDFMERVRSIVTAEMGGGDVSARGIASKLKVSERTLRRRIQASGTSHRQLVEELRRRMAEHHLERRELGVAEIAFLLGFSEASAFNRAFKRWTGCTPGEFRSRSTLPK